MLSEELISSKLINKKRKTRISIVLKINNTFKNNVHNLDLDVNFYSTFNIIDLRYKSILHISKQ